MRKIFEYREIEVGPLAWPTLGDSFAIRCAEQATAAGGALYGAWMGQIGLARDEGIVMTAWNDIEAAKQHGARATAMDGVTSGPPRYLEATVRPTRDEQPRLPGFYAHRWFELPVADWAEFLMLSDEAWPSMESAVDAQIQGFWRAIESAQEPDLSGAIDGTRVLLLTRYATLDDWERSRWWGRPDPSAKAAMERFRRRSTLVRRTEVVISTLPPSWTLSQT